MLAKQSIVPKRPSKRRDLDRLEVGNNLPISEAKRPYYATLISGYFNKQTEKRFSISNAECKPGEAKIYRIA